MRKIFLCGNTGTMNRGCEAIIRGSVEVLRKVKNRSLCLATFAPYQDLQMVRETGIDMIAYSGYPTRIHRYFSSVTRYLFKRSLAGIKYIQRPLWNALSEKDISLNIGGDTYCYGRPIMSLGLNNFCKSKKIPNILWCCSIEKDRIKGEIKSDLNKYKYIFAREKITYDNLIESGFTKDKIIKVCDPAFFLKTKEIPLPEGFIEGNTVGINLSEMVVHENNPATYQNVVELINWILEETDMSVCLIPHVYNIERNCNDYPILKKLYADINNPRVSLIDKEYDCEQLKYIIGKCRFFIGARTHSTIAAYSSEVPTLVIGYSVKSKGIATDLFGEYDGYVIPWTEINRKGQLLGLFTNLMNREDQIRKRYAEVLPQYRKSLLDAIEKYFPDVDDEKITEVCDKNLCTGCSACAKVCPKQCITMTADAEGFVYPVINQDSCISCGKCRSVCPSINKPKDDGKIPVAFAIQNKNEDIRANSSSGGVFYLLANKILSMKGVVYGAGFNEDFDVCHKRVDNEQGVKQLMGSKYVQSEIGDTYISVRKDLDEGKTVLFTGTPCQIAGLQSYLNRDYDNLYCQDLICHGVPSPKIWKKYRQQISQGKTLNGVSFRNKASGWKRYSTEYNFTDGSKTIQPASQDAYMRSFLLGLSVRPSCFNCSFRMLHRKSDITLADFWGIENLCPEIDDNKGTSLAIIHTQKGKELLDSVFDDIKCTQVEVLDAIKSNTSCLYFKTPSPFRKAFFKNIDKKNIKTLTERYYGNSLTSKLRRMIKKF